MMQSTQLSGSATTENSSVGVNTESSNSGQANNQTTIENDEQQPAETMPELGLTNSVSSASQAANTVALAGESMLSTATTAVSNVAVANTNSNITNAMQNQLSQQTDVLASLEPSELSTAGLSQASQITNDLQSSLTSNVQQAAMNSLQSSVEQSISSTVSNSVNQQVAEQITAATTTEVVNNIQNSLNLGL
jgi:hypothetical protein